MWEEGVHGNSVPSAQLCCEPKTALKKQSIKKEILKKKKNKEILSVLPIPGNHFPFYCLHNTAFSRMSNSWNHTVYDLFRLASFTW